MLGAWLAGCVFMDLVATQNFRSVDRLLAVPPAHMAERIQILGGHDMARVFLRYHSSELNRLYFTTWERAQILLGLALFFVLLFGTRVQGNNGQARMPVLLAVSMLAIVILMHFYLTPEITRLGRLIDFVPPGTPSAERTRFWTLHGAYSGCELGKLGLG